MAKKNFYDILGVSKNASEAEIKAAFRKLTLKYHPDKLRQKLGREPTNDERKRAEEEFKEIKQAYEVLGNSEKRQHYDRYGSAEGFAQGPPEGGFGQEENFFKDIFETFFGGRETSYSSRGASTRNRNRPQRGSDILVNIALNFKESVLGVKKKITLELERACPVCQQTGAASHSDVVECSTCQGRGVVNTIQKTILGAIRTQVTCSRCQGEGRVIKKKCKKCSGKAFVPQTETIELNIPRGIPPSEKLRYQRIGNEGWHGGERGDIYVAIKVKENPYFRRKGDDIHIDLPISFLDAILGSTVKVIVFTSETTSGEVKTKVKEIKISPGSQNGDCLVWKGYGCYSGINKVSRGDLYIWLQVKLPKKITPTTEEILSSLQQRTSWNPNRDFIEKNKDIIDE
jgi:molecular chaperone DnaJ